MLGTSNVEVGRRGCAGERLSSGWNAWHDACTTSRDVGAVLTSGTLCVCVSWGLALPLGGVMQHQQPDVGLQRAERTFSMTVQWLALM